MTSIEIDFSSPFNSVSVILAAHNAERFIAETLQSILSQTIRPAEVIVVNDASTDRTVEVVGQFGAAISLIDAKCRDARAARNIGAARAKSTWIAFCDADDIWLPTKLEKQLRLANESPDIHCVLTDFAYFQDGVVSARSHFSYAPAGFWGQEPRHPGFVVRTPITGKLTLFQPGITSTPIVKRSFYEQEGGFDEQSPLRAHDTCYMFRCLRVVPFGVIPEVLMHYRRYPDSMSANTFQQLQYTVRVWEYMIANYPQTQPFRADLRKGLRAMRKEILEMRIHRWKQKVKHLLSDRMSL